MGLTTVRPWLDARRHDYGPWLRCVNFLVICNHKLTHVTNNNKSYYHCWLTVIAGFNRWINGRIPMAFIAIARGSSCSGGSRGGSIGSMEPPLAVLTRSKLKHSSITTIWCHSRRVSAPSTQLVESTAMSESGVQVPCKCIKDMANCQVKASALQADCQLRSTDHSGRVKTPIWWQYRGQNHSLKPLWKAKSKSGQRRWKNIVSRWLWLWVHDCV